MLELQYIPLKSSAGQVAGHAFVRDGFMELRMRMRTIGSALVLTDKGSVTGRIGAGIALNGTVEAVAIVDGGKILFHGTPRGSRATAEDIRRRLLTMRQSSVNQSMEQDLQDPAAAQPVVQAEVSAAPVRAQEQDAAAAYSKPKPRTIVAKESAPIAKTSQPCAAWEDEASLAAITRRAEEAFSRMERKSAEARAAIDAVLEPMAVPETASVPPLAQRKKKARSVHAPEPASPRKEEDGIEAILRRLGSRTVSDAPLPRVSGSTAHAEEYTAPSDEREADQGEQTSDGWRALFQAERRETPPVFAAAPLPRETPVPNPFPHIFPNASFIRVQDETLPYLSGTWQRGSEHFTITAVPGSYSPTPPAHLQEYNRFIRARSGGYWVLVREAQQ